MNTSSLFFSILTQDIDLNSDADVYISKQKFPGSDWNISNINYDEQNVTKSCTSYGYDLCILSDEEISQLDNFIYFGIRCYQ